MKVVFTGSTPEQVRWGGNSDPEGVLVVGMEYEVEMQVVHSWHTKTKLKGIDGWFNSVCFRDVDFSQHGKTIVGDAAIIADRDAALARAERAEAALKSRVIELEVANRGLARLNEATEARAEKAEATAAKLADALEEIASYDHGPTAGVAFTAKTALAEYEASK